MPSGSRRRPALWFLSGLGLVAFFLILGSGSANAETDPAAPPDQSLLGTVSEVGAGVTGTLAEQAAPVTGTVRDEVVEPVVQPVTDPVTETVRDVVEPVLEPVVQPVRDRVVEPVRDVVKPVTQPVRDAVEPVVAPVRDEVVKPVVTPIAGPGDSGPAADPTPEPAPEPDVAPSPETAPETPADISPAPTQADHDAVQDAVQAVDADSSDPVVPSLVSTNAGVSTAAATPATDDRPVINDRDGDDRQQPTPLEPTAVAAVGLTATHPGPPSSQSGSGDNHAGGAAAVLPDSRTGWHCATWALRVVPADHVLPSSVAHRPGFSPD